MFLINIKVEASLLSSKKAQQNRRKTLQAHWASQLPKKSQREGVGGRTALGH